VNLVLDASMALSWHFQRVSSDEDAISRDALATVGRSDAFVPALWYTEVSNSVLVGERRRIVTQLESTTFLQLLSGLLIVMDSAPPQSTRDTILTLARQHNLTAYDANYLELALRTASTLATFDRRLAEAARACGVPVFGDRA